MADIQDNNKEKKIQVAIRVRPVIDRENGDQELWEVTDSKTICRNSTDVFQFDRVFSGQETNLDVYDAICKPIIEEVIKGFNATIFAYGQTSSGKTYTMMGDDFTQGVIHYAINDIFKMIQTMNDREFLLRVSVLEIYNEKVYDLLSQKNDDLRLREDSYGVLKVCDLKEKIVQTSEQIWSCILDGQTKRRTAETQMNRTSSRSHFIFRMIIESSLKGEEDPIVNVSQLNLVDLAGSEKTSLNIGKRFKEGAFINLSLSTLTQVINKLSEKSGQFINYRNSKLTRILQNSLGGNAHTAIICTVTPVSDKETYSTLSFASSAIKIKNKPQKNEILTDEAMLKRYANEIKKLSQELKTIKEQGELELEEKTRQNENLKKQIEKLKANFVGQSPQNNLVNPRAARRETLCCVSETKKLLNFRNAAVRFPSNFPLSNISEEECETESELPDLMTYMKHRNSRGTSRLSSSSLSSTSSSRNNQKDIGVQTSSEMFEDNNADIDELMTMISDLKSQLTTLQNEYTEQTEYDTLEKQILKAEHELQVENQELRAENVILKRKLESKSLLEKSHLSLNECKELESNLSKHDFLESNNNKFNTGKLINNISFNNSLMSEKCYSNRSMKETSRMTVNNSTFLDDSHEKSNFLALYDEIESDTISKLKSEIEALKHDIEIKNKQVTLLNDKILIKDQIIASLQDEIALNKNTDSQFYINDKTAQLDKVCQTDSIHISPTKSLNSNISITHITEDKFTEVTPRKSREFSTQYCRNEIVDEHFVQTSPIRNLNFLSECMYKEDLKVDTHSEISDSFFERTFDAKELKSRKFFHQSSQTSPVSLREIDKESNSDINNEVFIPNLNTPKESDICRCGYFSDEIKILIKKISDLKHSVCNILKKCIKTEYLKDADKYLSDNDCYSKSALETATDLETLLSILEYYISNRDQDCEIINNELESKFQEANMLDSELSEVKQTLNIKESELSSLRDLFFDLKQSFSQLTSICQVLNNVDSQEKLDEIKQRSNVIPSQSFRLEFEVTMFKNHFVKLNSYIEENASKIITLSGELKKVKSELAAAQKEGFKLLENNYLSKNTVTKSIQTSQDLNATDTIEKDSLILELKKEINTLREQINYLEEEKKALKKDIDDLYNSDSETIENMEKEREKRWKIKTEMLIKDLEQKYEQELVDQEKRNAEELIYREKKFAEELNIKIQEIMQENLKQMQDLKVEIERMKSSHSKEMSAIKNQHEDQLASVNSEKQALETKHEEKISALKEKYIAKQNKFIKAYSELNVRVQHYMKEIEKLKKENTPSNQLQVMEKLKEKISELSDEKDMLQKKCTRTDLQISELKAHNNYLKNELKKITDEEPNQNTLNKLSKLEEMNKQLLYDLDQKKAKIMTLQSNNASMLQELKKLKEMQLSKASVSCKCKNISKESNLDIPEKNEHKKDRKSKTNPKDELEDQMKIAKQRPADENATSVHNDFSNNRTPDQNALLCVGGGSGPANMVKSYWLEGIVHQKDKEIQKLKEELRDLKSQLKSKRLQPMINEEQSEIKEKEVKKETKKVPGRTPVSPLQEIDENVTVQLKTSHPYPGGAVPKIPKKHASREKNGLTTSKPYDKHKNMEHIKKENVAVDWHNPVRSNVNNEPKTKYDVVNQLTDPECKQQ